MTETIAESIADLPLLTIHWHTQEQAFRALKWFAPDAVRLIRGNFDVGAKVADLVNLVKGPNTDMVVASIHYMADHPESGRIRWLSKEQWDWADQPPNG
jgi:hypothetical protein